MKDKGILIGYDGDFLTRISRNEKGEITAGLVVGKSLYQNQFIILKSHKGELKEYPVLGVGFSDVTNDNDMAGWNSEIKQQLEKDGMQVKSVKVDRHLNVEIEASYENK